jgi:hypothetical protein
MRLGVLPCTAWPLSRASSLELSFPSALAGHAALLGLPRLELFRFDVRRPGGFSLSES